MFKFRDLYIKIVLFVAREIASAGGRCLKRQSITTANRRHAENAILHNACPAVLADRPTCPYDAERK